MKPNKVILNGEVLIDLSNDNVTEEDVLEGVIFHRPDGEQAIGTGKNGSGGFVEVDELPAENLDRDVVYKVSDKCETGVYVKYPYFSGSFIEFDLFTGKEAGYYDDKTIVTCDIHVVDDLPEVGIPSIIEWSDDYSCAVRVEYHVYIDKYYGDVYLYIDDPEYGIIIVSIFDWCGDPDWNYTSYIDDFADITENGIYFHYTQDIIGIPNDDLKPYQIKNGEWYDLTRPQKLFHKMVSGDITELTPQDLYGVPYITSYAFYNRVSLIKVELPYGISSIGTGAFEYCNNLTSVYIPDSVTWIDYDVFSYCSNLVDVRLPLSTGSIQATMFYHCVNLETIVIPANIRAINRQAFSYCSRLACVDLTSYGSDAPFPQLDGTAFDGASNTFEIRVPAGRKEELAAMKYWSEHADRIVEVE